MNYMGIDLGTTGCKVCTFSENGDLLYRAYRKYPCQKNGSGLEELDPELVADFVQECIIENNANMGTETAEGLSISVSGDECIFLDEQMKSLGPVIMSRDRRGQEELEGLLTRYSAEFFFRKTGLPIHRKYGVFRLMWYKTHEPASFQKIRHVMTWEDFLQVRIGIRRPVCSYSSAARLMLIDLEKKCYLDDIISTAGLQKEWFSDITESGRIVGLIEAEKARSLGFKYPVYIATGGFDQSCAAAGAGLSKNGTAVVGSGTMESLSISIDKPLLTPYFMKGQYPTNYHLYPNLYICTATNVGGSAIVNWYYDQIEEPGVKESGYDAMIGQCSVRPSGLLALPHFAGSGPPYKDTDSMGAIIGLQINTTKRKILQAILEGITYELRQNLEMIESGCKEDIKEIRAVGGGAKSDYWLQLKADITGRTIVRMKNEEAGCAAGAMAAMVALNKNVSWEKASEIFSKKGRAFLPSKERKGWYDPYYQAYCTLYPLLKDNFHELRKIQREGREYV